VKEMSFKSGVKGTECKLSCNVERPLQRRCKLSVDIAAAPTTENGQTERQEAKLSLG